MTKIYPIDPPIGGLSCRNCGDPIAATHQVFGGGMSLKGLRDYEWIHEHGSEVCQSKTVARPYDAWQATAKVGAVLREREVAADALIDAMEHEA